MGKNIPKRAIKLILSTPMAIIFIIWGIPGMIEDLTTWMGWLGDAWSWLSATPTPMSFALVIMGLVILFRPQRILKRKRHIEPSNEVPETNIEAKTENAKAEKKPRIVSSVLLANNQHIHKCSKCEWGFAVDKYTTGVVCPECGNADDIILKL